MNKARVIIEVKKDSVNPNAVLVAENVFEQLGLSDKDLVVLKTDRKAIVVKPVKASITPNLVIIGENVGKILGVRDIELGEIVKTNIMHVGKAVIEFKTDIPDREVLDNVKKYLRNKIVRKSIPIRVKTGKGVVELAIHADAPTELIYISNKTILEVKTGKTRKYVQSRKTRELLESIVAKIFNELGFSVETNTHVRLKSGLRAEVDVRAYKVIEDTMFEIWVECKNWNKYIGRDAVDKFYSTIINSIKSPNMAIIIAKELSKDAYQEAKANGFLVITLGDKAREDNLEQIENIIKTKITRIFTLLAPVNRNLLNYTEEKGVAET
ncbi:MAG: hypothetical protein DRO40_04295 [Thermoprotei archaeon]|nr:MAG: hypothetical protein DRO40_04295 [Thermoprotei archaeon]